MICPQCQTILSDDTVICENCNFILDTTFLGDSITNETSSDDDAVGDDEVLPGASDNNRTRIKQVNLSAPAASTPAQAAGRQAAKTAPPAKVRAEAAPEPESRAAARSRIEAEADEPAKRRVSLDKLAAPPSSVGETIYELRERFKEFPVSERITTVAGGLFVVSLGLPWRWSVKEEDVIGLFADAWPIGIAALVVCISAYVRRIPSLRPLKQEILFCVLGTSILALATTAIYFSRSFERETTFGARMRQVEVLKMYPHVGAVIGLLSAVAMVGGSAISVARRGQIRD